MGTGFLDTLYYTLGCIPGFLGFLVGVVVIAAIVGLFIAFVLRI